MKEKYLKRLQGKFEDVEASENGFKVCVQRNYFTSTTLKTINECLDGYLSYFETTFDINNDCMYVYVEMDRKGWLLDNGWWGYNYATGNYNISYDTEYIDNILDEDVQLEENEKIEILERVFDNEYFSEVISEMVVSETYNYLEHKNK